jgi:integrase
VVRSEETRVKNVDSIRFIPIHPMLKNIGFLKFVEWRKMQKDRFLFPELSGHSVKGKPVSSWFSLYIKKACNIKNKVDLTKIGFHSFRNNFANEYKQKGTPVHFAGETLGHKTVGMTYGVYGSKIDIKTKYEQLTENVQYSGVNFPWLSGDYIKGFPWEK